MYTYRLYVADSLFYNGENKHLAEKLSKIIERMRAPRVYKTGDEVAEDVLKRHGLKFRKESDG